MPGVVVFVLVIVALHALTSALGGWALLEENYSRQEHGQEALVPIGAAWFVALICWGLAGLNAVCVVLARKRRTSVRVLITVSQSFMAFSSLLGTGVSVAAGAPSPVLLVLLLADAAALFLVCGEHSRRWFSLSGPAGVPADVVNKLNSEVRRILQLPDVRERLGRDGIMPNQLDPKAFAGYVASEVKRWGPVIKKSGAVAN